MKIDCWRRIAVGLVGALLVLPIVALSESPTNEELLATIKKLEARLAELEAKAGKTAEAATTKTTEEQPAKAEPSTTEAPSASNGNGNGNSFFKGLSWEGMVDGYYGYNFNKPYNRTNQLRNFDFNHN